MFTPITITGDLVNPDGSLASGAFRFQLSQQVNGIWVPCGMTDSSTGEVVSAAPIQTVWYQGKLLVSPQGGGGYQPVVLLATDDPTTLPTGLEYVVTEQLTAGSLPAWNFVLPHATSGGTLNIGTVRPTP
jgi:hypothetical protein